MNSSVCCRSYDRAAGCGGEALPRLLLELRLTGALGGLHALDLALDGREEALALAELPLDRPAARGPLGDDLRLARAVAPELRAPRAHLVAEATDVLQHLRVLATDAGRHVEPVEQVVEALGPENHLDGAAGVAVDVERAEPLRDVRLRQAEARSRGDQVAPVRLQRSVELAELDVRQVVGLDRVGEARVHLLDLGEDRLGLLPLRRDRGIGGRRSGADQEERGNARECESQERKLSSGRVVHVTSRPANDRPADGGITGHKFGSLAPPEDVCTRK